MKVEEGPKNDKNKNSIFLVLFNFYRPYLHFTNFPKWSLFLDPVTYVSRWNSIVILHRESGLVSILEAIFQLMFSRILAFSVELKN